MTTEVFETYVRKELKGLDFAPIAFTSGLENLNVHGTIDLAHDLHSQAGQRVTTGKLNRMLRVVIERRPPPNKLGTRPKVYFVAQTSVRPVTIVLVVNRPQLFAPNYQRFLVNRLRGGCRSPRCRSSWWRGAGATRTTWRTRPAR